MTARTYRRLARPDRSLEHYRKYAKDAGTSPHATEARKHIADLAGIIELVNKAEALRLLQMK